MRLAILQPAGSDLSRAHYRDTVTNPVRLDSYADELGADHAVLESLYPSGAAPLWGATPGRNDANVGAYRRISPGDYVFFAGSGRLFAGATVTHSFRNPRLAEILWGRDDKGQTWELMFSLDELRDFDITYAEMNRAVGYNERNIVQGFTVLDADRSAALFDFLELDSDLHPAAPTLDELRALLAALPAGSDEAVTAVRRLEQGLLRRALIPGRTGTCAICGDELPVQFLVAAHIKKRAHCTEAERLDIPAVAMPACKFGCDALFEEGYIGITDDGTVLVSPLAPRTGAAAGYLARVQGRRVGIDLTARFDYIRWHRDHTYKQAP